jgi:hypothetical protein
MSNTAKYYLGIDCATKTFGFALLMVDIERYQKRRAYLLRRAKELRKWILTLADDNLTEKSAISCALDELEEECKGFLQFLDGETADLVPGKPDAEIHTIERLKAFNDYYFRRIIPAIAPYSSNNSLSVIIEFQEGVNSKTRIIAPAVVATFLSHYTALNIPSPRIYFVGPSLKNKLNVGEKGHYAYFAERYAKSYDANKAHAKHTFAELEKLFGTHIPATKPASLRGHIADAATGILGHLAFGDNENPENHF